MHVQLGLTYRAHRAARSRRAFPWKGPSPVKHLQRWIWVLGAVVTLTASVFILLTMNGVRDSSRAAGDLGELRAYSERIRNAAVAGDAPRLASLIESRHAHITDLEPALRAVGDDRAVFALDSIDQTFDRLEAAALAGQTEELPSLVSGVTAQVDLLLGVLAADRDAAVTTVRRTAAAAAALAVAGAAAAVAASVIAGRRMRHLAAREASANRRYEALVASMQNGILVTDDQGVVAYCNRALAEMFGFQVEELVGQPASMLLPAGEDADGPVDAVRRGEVMPPTLAQRAGRDGARVDVVIAVTPIFEGDRCVATLSEFRNVTQEVALRARVGLEIAKGEGIMDAAPVPIVVMDAEGVVIAANPAVHETLGWAPDDLVGQPVSVLMPEPFASQHMDYLRHFLDTGEASTEGGLVVGRERPAFALHRAGHQIPIGLRVAQALTEDGQRVFTGVIYDLTRQSNQEGERLQLLESLMQGQRDVALGAMVGGVAHDFNNLLTAIAGALDLEISARGQSSRWLDHASVAARRASAVVRRLLQTVRPRTTELYPTDVWEVVMETVELARETFDRRVSIQANRAGHLPLVLADNGRLGQVFLNLLLNARDAVLERSGDAGPGYAPEVRLAAGTTQDAVGRAVVRVVVSDNGAGMAPEVLERIFDPFFTTKREGRGSGLGLAMVRSIVREIDATIEVESHQGIGTSVTVDIPSLGDEFVDPRPAPESRPERAHVLVVDDEEIVREVAGSALERDGYQVSAAASGEEALENLRLVGQCDLVLLDLNMPGMGGWETLARLQERHPGLPVVIMSATVWPVEAARSGACGTLEKPFAMQDLLATVERVLERERDVDAGRGARRPATS